MEVDRNSIENILILEYITGKSLSEDMYSYASYVKEYLPKLLTVPSYNLGFITFSLIMGHQYDDHTRNNDKTRLRFSSHEDSPT